MNLEPGLCYLDGYASCSGALRTDGKLFIAPDNRRYFRDGRLLTLQVDLMKDLKKLCGCKEKK